MNIKPIETKYKGYRFRSRLEARWAVFFDALEEPWEYEIEGFDLGDLGWYLPDFYLPKMGIYVEIKKLGATDIEKEKCLILAHLTGKAVALFEGAPGQFSIDRNASSCDGTIFCWDVFINLGKYTLATSTDPISYKIILIDHKKCHESDEESRKWGDHKIKMIVGHGLAEGFSAQHGVYSVKKYEKTYSMSDSCRPEPWTRNVAVGVGVDGTCQDINSYIRNSYLRYYPASMMVTTAAILSRRTRFDGSDFVLDKAICINAQQKQ